MEMYEEPSLNQLHELWTRLWPIMDAQKQRKIMHLGEVQKAITAVKDMNHPFYPKLLEALETLGLKLECELSPGFPVVGDDIKTMRVRIDALQVAPETNDWCLPDYVARYLIDLARLWDDHFRWGYAHVLQFNRNVTIDVVLEECKRRDLQVFGPIHVIQLVLLAERDLRRIPSLIRNNFGVGGFPFMNAYTINENDPQKCINLFTSAVVRPSFDFVDMSTGKKWDKFIVWKQC